MMIYTNAISLLLVKHDQNGVCNQNLHSIQDMMCSDEPVGTNVKRVCADLPNIALLTNIATPGEIQVTFGHTYIGKKSLDETVSAFALTGSLESPMVVSIDTEHAFVGSGKISISGPQRSSFAPLA